MDYRKEFRVKPDARVKLQKMDPGATPGIKSEADASQLTADTSKKLAHLHAKLYAESKRSVLIVLQGLDAAGKDGTIKHAFTVLNPEGTTVASFRQPTPVELKHDFLWRVHPHVPGKGEIVIFNRSHYEDVLVTRVHKLIGKDVWTKRYDDIRAFESLLVESGAAILKFFLHISPEEQLRRFEERLDDPTHNWKISESDYSERELWDDYIAAFEDALQATSTKDAPWYVIPSNHKWFRTLAVSQILTDTLEDMKLAFPAPTVDLADIRKKYHAAEEAEKSKKNSKRNKD